MPSLIARLIPQFSLLELEAVLVQKFCQENNLSPKSILLQDLLVVDTAELTPFFQDVSCTVEYLVKAFEELVPSAEAKSFGAVFTPKEITAFLASFIPDSTKNVIDPSCGCGALLIAAFERLVQLKASPEEALRNLYGVDISEFSIHRAKILLSLIATTYGYDVPMHPLNLHVGDALSLDYQTVFNTAQFDVVVGNPPYVRFQNLDVDTRKNLQSKFETTKSGNINLYFVFFELSQRLRAPGGVVAYITPNAFFSAASAASLRGWMVKEKFLAHVLDFGSTRVFDASTYTAITISGPCSNTFTYERLSSLNDLAVWNAKTAPVVPLSSLTSTPWRLSAKQDRQIVESVLRQERTVSDVAHVRYGLATLRDKVYALSSLSVKVGDEILNIEKDITKPLRKIPLLRTQSDLSTSQLRVIYPYNVTPEGPRIIKEEEFATKYPQAYKYLLHHKAELLERDRGKKTYPEWYAYGRTQGLTPLGEKLLTPLYAHRARFLRDTSEESLFVNGCGVVMQSNSDMSLEVLQAFLSSRVVSYYIAATSPSLSGDFYAWQKSHMAPVGIPDLGDICAEDFLALSPAARENCIQELYKVQIPDTF